MFAGLYVMFWFFLEPINIDVPLNSTQSTELLDFEEIHVMFSEVLLIVYNICPWYIFFCGSSYTSYVCYYVVFKTKSNILLARLHLLSTTAMPFIFNDSFLLKKLCTNCFSS